MGSDHTALMPAEARVAVLLLEGKTPTEAAADLGVALPTVRTHIYRLHQKTHAHNLGALLRWCRRYFERSVRSALKDDPVWLARSDDLVREW